MIVSVASVKVRATYKCYKFSSCHDFSQGYIPYDRKLNHLLFMSPGKSTPFCVSRWRCCDVWEAVNVPVLMQPLGPETNSGCDICWYRQHSIACSLSGCWTSPGFEITCPTRKLHPPYWLFFCLTMRGQVLSVCEELKVGVSCLVSHWLNWSTYHQYRLWQMILLEMILVRDQRAPDRVERGSRLILGKNAAFAWLSGLSGNYQHSHRRSKVDMVEPVL